MEDMLSWAVNIGFILVVAAVAMALLRMIKGPSLPDRVVALDMMTIAIVAFCGLSAVRTGESAFLDVALVLALVGFLATVALARYAERQVIRREQAEDDT
ncbi:MAG: cation:proton antiporter [Pseudomonadota bacterium]